MPTKSMPWNLNCQSLDIYARLHHFGRILMAPFPMWLRRLITGMLLENFSNILLITKMIISSLMELCLGVTLEALPIFKLIFSKPVRILVMAKRLDLTGLKPAAAAATRATAPETAEPATRPVAPPVGEESVGENAPGGTGPPMGASTTSSSLCPSPSEFPISLSSEGPAAGRGAAAAAAPVPPLIISLFTSAETNPAKAITRRAMITTGRAIKYEEIDTTGCVAGYEECRGVNKVC
ncbi:hypothetical protein G4B88_006287 [Cannabis sativa]|uniref:Uncharacterized protein n=1 Tax=Cannabis sativa TaxID=3483 RepID=A0A7J6ICU6_CANSA|nr:hypothetical protein G4B88_006287 [Cannabis sativa]